MAGNVFDIDSRWYIVVRCYRGKRRVLSIHAALSEAETSYAKHEENFRDGDLLLAVAHIATLEHVSGGYNRTRW